MTFCSDIHQCGISQLALHLVSYPAPTTQKAREGSGQKGRTLVSPRNVIKRLRVRVH